ncbi:MAG TPA: septal ring lytic transglycosylase RlpA family protein [Egibacteraceae bacterium]|nr:septal ring lytic transglycosylase RlpA family protein [Egibacteraceae bacterium]
MLQRSGSGRRAATWGAGLLVSLLLPVLGFLWLSGEKTVTLSLPSGVRQVRTHAATVGELLSRRGTDPNPFYDVAPGMDAALIDGMTIRVVVDTPVSLEYQMLSHLSARFSAHAPPEAQASAFEPAAPEPVDVAVSRDGQSTSVSTHAASVGELLAELGITLDADDRVAPSPDSALSTGMDIVVQRVDVSSETRVEAIAFPAATRETDQLLKGERREIQAGVAGEVEITEEVVRVDGVEESRRTTAERVVREPQPQVIEVGVAEPPPPEPTPTPTPESAPAPESDDPAENIEEGGASWYDAPGTGFTAAHRTLPKGTIVTVTNTSNGRSVQVTINDRGPYVAGRIIDLSKEAFAEIGSLSRGVINVRIEW